MSAGPAPGDAPVDLLVLSPHLDDAVLSLGALLAGRRWRGDRVLVVTVFAGDEAAAPSPLARQLHRSWGLDAAVVAARRREDLAALEVLGVEALHWPLQEAIYRTDRAGAPRYGRVAELFRAAGEERIEGLRERLAALPTAAVRLVPLAVGGHVDHRWVRLAAEDAWADSVVYYEELPYATRLFSVRRARGAGSGWRRLETRPGAAALAAKCDAVAAYRSQLASLFGGEPKMRRRLGRLGRRRGERLWRRVSAPDGSWPAALGGG